MPASPAHHVFGDPTFALVRRFATTATADVNAAGTSTAQLLTGPSLAFPPAPAGTAMPNPKQVLRTVFGAALITDLNATHFLTCLGANVQLQFGSGNTLLRAWNPAIANVLLGPAGVQWNWQDDELKGTDYIELTNPTGPNSPTWTIEADITNSDAAVHAVHFRITMLFELYEQQTMMARRRR